MLWAMMPREYSHPRPGSSNGPFGLGISGPGYELSRGLVWLVWAHFQHFAIGYSTVYATKMRPVVLIQYSIPLGWQTAQKTPLTLTEFIIREYSSAVKPMNERYPFSTGQADIFLNPHTYQHSGRYWHPLAPVSGGYPVPSSPHPSERLANLTKAGQDHTPIDLQLLVRTLLPQSQGLEIQE